MIEKKNNNNWIELVCCNCKEPNRIYMCPTAYLCPECAVEDYIPKEYVLSLIDQMQIDYFIDTDYSGNEIQAARMNQILRLKDWIKEK